MVVNNRGTRDFANAPLDHSKWNGCTPTDLVFPFFNVIFKVRIGCSFDQRKEIFSNLGLTDINVLIFIIFDKWYASLTEILLYFSIEIYECI